MSKMFEVTIREQIRALKANIRWLEETDRYERIPNLEQRLEELKEQLEGFEI